MALSGFRIMIWGGVGLDTAALKKSGEGFGYALQIRRRSAEQTVNTFLNQKSSTSKCVL